MRLFMMVSLAFAVSGLQGASIVCWEAESVKTIEEPMVKVDKAAPPSGVKAVDGASGDLYLEIPEGKGNPPKITTGKAVYEVDVPADGEYVLWARVYWNGECSNSFGVSIDENKAFSFGQDATYKSWHWVRSPRRLKQLNLKRGKVTVSFANREEQTVFEPVDLRR